MSLKVAYIPHGPGDQDGARWGEDIMLKNLIANVSKDIQIIPSYDAWVDAPVDLIFHHNLANTAMARRRWVRGGSWLERRVGHPIPALYRSNQDLAYLSENRPKLFGGIRGTQGLNKARKILKYFDAVHTSNDYLTRKSREYGAPEAYTLYPGVDMDLFKPMPELRQDTFTVGWAGDTTKPMKNAAYIAYLGYRHKVASKEFYIPHAEMPKFYNSLDVYVYFSSHEGCNRTILEAMACGLPVVTSDAGAVRRLIHPDNIIEGDPTRPGWIHRFRNRVEYLREKPHVRKALGHMNRERVSPWAWPTIAKRFSYLCDRVVNG